MILALMLFTVTANAQQKNDASAFSVRLVRSSDDVNFNIASDLSGTQTPNVMSELLWTDMEIWSLEASIRLGLGKHFKFAGDVSYGTVYDGLATNNGYFGDYRTGLESQSVAQVNGKDLLKAMLGIGWQLEKEFAVPLWKLADEKRMAFSSHIKFTPIIGFSTTQHQLKFTDGIQVVPDLGPFPGLSSSFDTEWEGFFGGFEGSFRIGGKFYITASGYYWPDTSYASDGNWNLRTDLNQPLSFVQEAEGDAFEYEVGLELAIGKNKSIGLSYLNSDFSTGPGTHTYFDLDGNKAFTRLNGAAWESSGYTLSLTWKFGN